MKFQYAINEKERMFFKGQKAMHVAQEQKAGNKYQPGKMFGIRALQC